MNRCRSCQKEIDGKAKKCPYCHEKQGNWLQRHTVLVGLIVFIIAIATLYNSNDIDRANTSSKNSGDNTETVEADFASEEVGVASDSDIEATDEQTVSQKSAIRKAETYLSVSGFSRSGLIDQLEFEKFSTEDATYAVDKLNPDWNEQAARKAKTYLDVSGFSRDGLIQQLEFEGFTSEQAVYGVESVGM